MLFCFKFDSIDVIWSFRCYSLALLRPFDVNLVTSIKASRFLSFLITCIFSMLFVFWRQVHTLVIPPGIFRFLFKEYAIFFCLYYIFLELFQNLGHYFSNNILNLLSIVVFCVPNFLNWCWFLFLNIGLILN